MESYYAPSSTVLHTNRLKLPEKLKPSFSFLMLEYLTSAPGDDLGKLTIAVFGNDYWSQWRYGIKRGKLTYKIRRDLTANNNKTSIFPCPGKIKALRQVKEGLLVLTTHGYYLFDRDKKWIFTQQANVSQFFN